MSIELTPRRANAERAQLSRVQQREIRMATMLMIVVLVFFMCNVLALVINLLEVSPSSQLSAFIAAALFPRTVSE